MKILKSINYWVKWEGLEYNIDYNIFVSTKHPSRYPRKLTEPKLLDESS